MSDTLEATILSEVKAIRYAMDALVKDVITGQLVQTKILNQILVAIQKAKSPVSFKLNLITKDDIMAKVKASIDFKLLDNGTATATLSFIDSVGEPTTLPVGATISVPSWASSDPSVVVVPAADGLSAAVSPATPPTLIDGVTLTAGTATITNADSSTETLAAVTSEGIDVIAGGPTGFAIALS
jgi:hypothetical protein